MSLRMKLLFSSAGALVVAAAALAACGGPVKRPDGGVGLLPVGAMAPDVTGRDASGHEVRLSEQRGARSVVYFYPKDETPGCTKEACAFRDSGAKFDAAHVKVFGISRDSQESHDAFAKHHQLGFPLVADPDGTLAKAYGVGSTLGMDARVSFLVGADGKIEKVWPDVDPAVHADDVLAAATK